MANRFPGTSDASTAPSTSSSAIRPYQFNFMLLGPKTFQTGSVGRFNNDNNSLVISGCHLCVAEAQTRVFNSHSRRTQAIRGGNGPPLFGQLMWTWSIATPILLALVPPLIEHVVKLEESLASNSTVTLNLVRVQKRSGRTIIWWQKQSAQNNYVVIICPCWTISVHLLLPRLLLLELLRLKV